MLKPENFAAQYLRSNVDPENITVMTHVDLKNVSCLSMNADKSMQRNEIYEMKLELFDAVYGSIIGKLMESSDMASTGVLADLLKLRDEITKEYENSVKINLKVV